MSHEANNNKTYLRIIIISNIFPRIFVFPNVAPSAPELGLGYDPVQNEWTNVFIYNSPFI